MKSGRSSLFLAIICSWLCSGCVLQTSQPAVPESQTSTVAPETEAPPELPARPFPTETLYSLLTAEIAGSREQFDIALSNYAQQAQQTRDPQIAERATMIARYLNDNAAAANSALLWVELDPQSDQALGNASYTLMQEDRLLEAFEMSRRLRARDQETLFQSIAANADSLTHAERETLLAGYLTELETYPADEQLLIGSGLLYQLQGKLESALQQARQALKFYPHSVPAALLDSSVLHQLKRTQEAVARLASALDAQPDNLRLRLQYARLLAHQDLAKAQQQFELLVKKNPEDPDLLLSLALVAMEEKDLDTAANALEQLLEFDDKASIASFYRGQVAELSGDRKKAVLHYLQVQPGEHFLQATVNLLHILVGDGDLLSARQHIDRLIDAAPEQADNYELLYAQALTRNKRFDTAETELNQSLSRSPNNTELRYARAMLFEQQDRLADAERDLRAIIAQEPNNAVVLNTLGYLLVDRTQRYAEAQEYLLRAIALRPDDPAIIDSVGWLHFRLGDYPEALAFLRRAFALYPDAEIAAHLGEVLWMIDEHEQALEVWQTSLERFPDNSLIKRTMDRLQVAP